MVSAWPGAVCVEGKPERPLGCHCRKGLFAMKYLVPGTISWEPQCWSAEMDTAWVSGKRGQRYGLYHGSHPMVALTCISENILRSPERSMVLPLLDSTSPKPTQVRPKLMSFSGSKRNNCQDSLTISWLAQSYRVIP